MSTSIANDLGLPSFYPSPAFVAGPKDAPDAASSRLDAASAGASSIAEPPPGDPKVRPGVSAAARPEDERGQEALKKLADDLGKALASSAKELKVSVDPALRQAVFRIVDSKSGNVVLQVPSEVAMRIRETLAEAEQDEASPAGALLKGTA